MSIAVTDVDARVRQITRRDNTTVLSTADLAAMILEACIEISERLLCLDGQASGTLSGDGSTLTIPTDMVKDDGAIKEFYLDSQTQDHLDYSEWRDGELRGVAYYDGTIYINPTSDNDRTYVLNYAKIHGALSTNLEFDDDLRMAVVWLTCKKTYDDFFSEDSNNQSLKAEKEYEQEVRKNEPRDPVICKIRKA